MPTITPNVDEDLSEGLSLSEDADGKLTLERVFHCSELIGANPVEIFSSALTLTDAVGAPTHTGGDVPAAASLLVVNGRKLFVKSRRLEPFPPNDATVYVAYSEANLSAAGYGPTIIECASTCEQDETEFDADELEKPWAQRTPITVLWDPSSAGAPGGGALKATPLVPIFVGKGVRTYRRQQTVDPETMAEDYVGRTNSGTWKGLVQDQALCISMQGLNQNSGAGLWDCIFQFAIDKKGLFRQVARYIDLNSGQVVSVTQAQFAASNGRKVVRVQGRVDFNALSL